MKKEKRTPIDEQLLAALDMARASSDDARKEKQVEAVKKALDAGANPNLCMDPDEDVEDNKNVLHDTVRGGTPEVVKLLLTHGADPNAPYWFKYDPSSEKKISSPLHYAVDRGNVPIVRALLLAGAKVNLKDHKGRTAADLAKKADIKELLSQAAAGKLKADSKIAPTKRSPVPKALIDFFAKEASRYEGASVPNFIAQDASTKVTFLKKPSEAVLDDRDVDPLTCPDYHVLAELEGEEHFLVVDSRKPGLPVLRWESETGKFEAVDSSLKAFLKRLQ